jgi:hypothetical protein
MIYLQMVIYFLGVMSEAKFTGGSEALWGKRVLVTTATKVL